MYILIGIAALTALLAVNLAALSAARYFIARAFGIPCSPFVFVPRSLHGVEGFSPWARPTIFVGCAAATYLVAATLFFLGFFIGGEEDTTTSGATIMVLDGRPAMAAGMRTGDRVVEIAGTPIEAFEAMAPALRSHAGEPIDVVVERAGAQIHLTVIPAKGAGNDGKIGVSHLGVRRDVTLGDSLGRGLRSPIDFLLAVANGVMTSIRGTTPGGVVGPPLMGLRVGGPMTATTRVGQPLVFVGMLDTYFWPVLVVTSLVVLPRRRRDGRGSK